MKYENLPNKQYGSLCQAMEEEGWVSRSIACCLRKPGPRWEFQKWLKKSKTFLDYKAGKNPPHFDNPHARDMILVFRDAKGKHSVPVRVNQLQGLVRGINGRNQEVSVAYLDDLKSGLRPA